MSDSVLLEGKEYVSARRAADATGYARDYIGQLARKGLIGAQRVGGLWYVSLESLKGYQAHADSYIPAVPTVQKIEMDAIVSFDGKDYVSASRAAKLSGYNQDYVGQLARAGKILSRQVGNRWYVEKDGLLKHKNDKDALLAAVQRESVGLPLPTPTRTESSNAANAPYTPFYSYVSEADKALMPIRAQEVSAHEQAISRIAKIQPRPLRAAHVIDMRQPSPEQKPRRGTTRGLNRAIKAGALLTFVILVSYGLTTLKSSSHYTVDTTGITTLFSQSASAITSSDTIERFTAYIESLISEELHYSRTR